MTCPCEEAAALVNLYPNPSRDGLVNLQLQIPEAEACNVTVYNALGEIVLMQQVASEQPQVMLDLSRQQAGMYIIRVSGKTIQFSEKLVLK